MNATVPTTTGRPRMPGALFGALLVILLIIVVVCGVLAYRAYAHYLDRRVSLELEAIADLKVQQLRDWRQERLADAETLHDNPAFLALVQRFLAPGGDHPAATQLLAWLERLRSAYAYERVLLLDTAGQVRVVLPASIEVGSDCFSRSQVEAALAAGQVQLADFHRDGEQDAPHLALIVPLGVREGREHDLGVLVLRVDPSRYLYPLLQRWPTPSATAETLLVRAEGDQVLFLNALRFQADTALALRLPLADPNLPAARAAQGHHGALIGVDYRGVPVLAFTRGVPDTPWALVARLDLAEIHAPLLERLMIIIVVGALLLGLVAAGLWLLWRQHQLVHFRALAAGAQALREREAFIGTVIDNLPIGLAVNTVGPEVRFLLLNDNFARFYQTTRDALTDPAGFWAAAYHDPEFRAQIRARVLEDCASGDPARMIWEDVPLTRPGQPTRYISARNIPLVGSAAMLSVVWDVTERRRAQLAQEALLAELQVKNDELLRFTYTVSHDLKSPLVTVQTFLGYLQRDLERQDQDAIDKDLGYIRGAARKMSELLDELLELSRVGRQPAPQVEVPLRAVIEEALGLVAGQLRERGVEVRLTAPPVRLYGARSRLVEVFQNLFDNAIKFMGAQAAPVIEVGLIEASAQLGVDRQARDEPGPSPDVALEAGGTRKAPSVCPTDASGTGRQGSDGQLVFFVRDNGIGIDPRHQGRIFGLFDKLDPRSPGSGIGLALVKRIVEVHGGRIWVQSTGLGQGSTFYFTLERARLDHDAPGADAAPDPWRMGSGE